MRKAVLQNSTALGILTASRGSSCALTQAQCRMFLPDESANVQSLLNHLRTQMNALSDPTPSLGDLINQYLGSWDSWWENIVTDFKYHCVNLCSLLQVPVWLLWPSPPVQPASQQTCRLCASEAPLLAARGTLQKRGSVCDYRSRSQGMECWRRQARGRPLVDPKLDPGNWRLFTPPWSLECMLCLPFHMGTVPRT